MTGWAAFWIGLFFFLSLLIIGTLLEEVNNHIYQRWRAKFLVEHKDKTENE